MVTTESDRVEYLEKQLCNLFPNGICTVTNNHLLHAFPNDPRPSVSDMEIAIERSINPEPHSRDDLVDFVLHRKPPIPYDVMSRINAKTHKEKLDDFCKRLGVEYFDNYEHDSKSFRRTK
jgi:hypothetical protein